ncbi:glycosyltransferase [Vibrio aphrogenes]|uniref:glycosyltransferase n=1 Tax=Vibrio aphrogenes TaxID=1891186 RepID=UPI000B351CA7|nr:glycosyltransferase [Vibrio aphrogenes]
MKIKFLIRDLKVEGVQVVTLRMAKLLVEKGHDVEVITLFDETLLPIDSVLKVTSLGVQPTNNKKKNNDLISLAFSKWYQASPSFDFLIASHSETIKLISKYNDKRLIPCIHNSDECSYLSRNSLKKYKYKFKLRRKLKNKHVFCVSESIKKFVTSCCGENVFSSIHTVYNPFDFACIQAKSMKPIPDCYVDNYIIFVGRIEKQKRLDRLVKAFSLIDDSQLKLIILGEGDLKPELENQVYQLGLQERVIFHDFVGNPYPWIRKARLLALTSDYEGLPTVLIESLSVGTPVVSVNCPSGPDEILTGDLSQYLVDSYDEKEIANKIKQVLANAKTPILESSYEAFSKQNVYHRLIAILNSL